MGKFYAGLYDILMEPLERIQFNKVRKNLVVKAEGRVLEIGSGTGSNFKHYRKVSRVDAIEPDRSMGLRSIRQAKKCKFPINIYEAFAENLPFEADSFDSVVGTLVFCTIPDPEKALQEIRRVSKPGARILLYEHVRMEEPILGKVQDLATPVWKKAFAGCHLNRDTLRLVKQAGLEIKSVQPAIGSLLLKIEAQEPAEGVTGAKSTLL